MCVFYTHFNNKKVCILIFLLKYLTSVYNIIGERGINKMKKRYNITLDASTYEEFKQYVDNVSGFLNSVIKRYVSFQKHKQEKEANDMQQLIASQNLWED